MLRWVLSAALAAFLIGAVSAQAPVPARLRWQPNQVLVYQIEHSTIAADKVGMSASEIKSLVRLTKRWQVQAVDARGVATLQLSMPAMFQERTTPSGDTLRYDSANPAKSTPELKSVLDRFLNVPLAVLRVDDLGQVAEVKESKFGPASNFEIELPFLGVLPATGLKAGATWQRDYTITLAPPLGTGEKYAAIQRYTCKSITATQAVVSLATELKAAPKIPGEQVPLWQMQPAGELTYDLTNGRLLSATLAINREAKDVHGPGSHTRFQSNYSLRYVGDR